MSLFRKRETEAQIDSELRFHIEQKTAELIAQGVEPTEARRRAMAKLGGIEAVKQEYRESRATFFLETVLQDLRYAIRMLRKSPGFTTVAVLTLALGIAANTTIFSAVSAILLRRPPVEDPARLCAVSSVDPNTGYALGRVSVPDFESWRAQNHVFKSLAAVEGRSFTLTGQGEPEAVGGEAVTPNYFSVTGVTPVLGRAFLPSEGEAGKDHVVILSHALWHARFQSSPSVVGRTLEINFEPYTIIGVMPPRKDFPPYAPGLWVPLVFNAKVLSAPARGVRVLSLVLGRLNADTTVSQAQVEMSAIAQRIAQTYPKTDKGQGVSVLTLQEFLIRRSGARQPSVIVMFAVGLVLLLACVNISGLLLARGTARRHEMAIRSAIGAARRRLVRQMLVESLILGGTSGAAGLIFSIWGIQFLRAGFDFNSYAREMAAPIHLDFRTFIFAAAVSFLATLAFGVLPAISASKVDPADALSEGGRAGPTSHAQIRLRNVLVTGEIALALMLLAGSGVLLREAQRELAVNPGINPSHLFFSEISLKGHRYDDPAARTAFFQQLVSKVQNLPGVSAAAVTTGVPLNSWSRRFIVIGRPPLPKPEEPTAQDFFVGPEYFRTVQVPLIKGREFSDSDNAHSQMVAIINQALARRYFPRGDAIGREIELAESPHRPARIIGVVGNVLSGYEPPTTLPQVYECYLQVPSGGMYIALRSRVSPAAIAPELRRAVWSVDSDQPVGNIETMEEIVAANTGGFSSFVDAMGIFALMALALAVVGIYGVVAYSVAQRTREFGIRMALGAGRREVLWGVLRQGMLLTGMGCAIGLGLAFPLPRLFAALFSGFRVQEPLATFGVTLVVAVLSLLAIYIPARRAMRVDPVVALRQE